MEFVIEVDAYGHDAARDLVQDVFTIEDFQQGTLIVESAVVEQCSQKEMSH